MDRQGRQIRRLGIGLAIGLLVGVAQAAEAPLHAMRWLAPGPGRVRALGERPAECLKRPERQDVYGVEVGRAAFRTPLLLGGQAARAGLSCETCHAGGRANRNFQFPGVSGRPGTADLTTALFSSRRSDGVDNPVPIPDLVGSQPSARAPHDPRGRALETFIQGHVTQAFDGAEPTPAVLAGLAAYVASLTPRACPKTPVETLRAGAFVSDSRRAVAAARGALRSGDHATAAFMASAARAPLGQLYERYDTPSLTADRASLRAADRDLAALAEAARSGDPRTERLLNTWLGQSLAWGAQLERDEPRSLFSRKRLAGL